MSDAKKTIRAVAVELFGEGIGCSDGGCVFGHPSGMHTNGGCGHLKTRDPHELRLTVRRLADIARKLAEGTVRT